MDAQGTHVFTTAGRAAILLALESLHVGPGHTVLVPTYHCPTMIEPVVKLGARPLFYPIGRSGQADPDFLRRIDACGVKALLAAHFFGLPQDLRPLRSLCNELGIALIEDCAHAFAGYSAAGPVGGLGDYSIASLPKFFAAVEGGCLVARTAAVPVLARRAVGDELRAAWDTLEIGAASGRLAGASGTLVTLLSRAKNKLRGRGTATWSLQLSEPDLAAACNTIDTTRAHARLAAFVHRVVRRADIDGLAMARRANYLEFQRLFADAPGLRPLFAELPEGAVPYVFPLWVDGDANRLYRAVRASGVPLYRWDMAWPGTPRLEGDVAGTWAQHVFQLACHQDMTLADVRAVAHAVTRLQAGGR